MHTTYFGNIEWYGELLAALQNYGTTDVLEDIIDSSERWQKQTERNRCFIATANGTQMLTVPVSVPEKTDGFITTGEIRISDHGNWRHLHWNALSSAYGMSPFFDYYADDIKPFFTEKWEFLADYNLSITKKMIELLGGEDIIRQKTIRFSSDKETKPYYQTFQKRHGFIPNLSVLDLLSNEGPDAVLFL